MKRVPGSHRVVRALRGVKGEVKATVKDINKQAAKELAAGRYEAAQASVEVARSAAGFQKEIDALVLRWKALRGAGGAPRDKADTTPLWKYYVPVLKAIEVLGGSARIGDLLPEVQRHMEADWLPGDTETMAGGRPRWQVMVRRARKHMIKQRFLEADSGLDWQVTAAGKKAAASGRVSVG